MMITMKTAAACTVTALLLLQLPTSSSTLSNNTPSIIDLSQDFPQDKAAMTFSPGAAAIQQAASQDPLIRAAIVLEHGDIVASYHRDDVDPNETTYQVFSATKSWTSLLIGMNSLLMKHWVMSFQIMIHGQMLPMGVLTSERMLQLKKC